ncbi:MAG TPA: hypothetical protein VNW92_11775 [Polyangiaceae bacterium]|nr:hypothetical protein [Polyangiaceae bacterium]
MRSLTVTAFALTLTALAACSAQSSGTPPRSDDGGSTSSGAGTGSTAGGATGFAGSPSGAAGTTVSSGGTSSGFAGSPSGFAGSPSGTAGSPNGTAGAPATLGGCKSTAVGTGSMGVIDDFETHVAGSALLPGGATEDGRTGGWGVDKSPTAVMTASMPLPVTGGDPGMALHFAGTDNITATPPGWGADAAVAIAGPGNCYDASAYTHGIQISLKSGGAATSVVVSIQTAEVLATNYASGPNGKEVPITTAWADYQIAWTDLATTYGPMIPLDLKSVHGVVIATSATGAASFDIWIDNLKFY